MSSQSEFLVDHKEHVLEQASRLKNKGSRQPKTHDYRKQEWGWALETHKTNIEGVFYVIGIGLDIKVGDSLLLRGKSGKTIRYEVTFVKYDDDPVDSWTGNIKAIEYV